MIFMGFFLLCISAFNSYNMPKYFKDPLNNLHFLINTFNQPLNQKSQKNSDKPRKFEAPFFNKLNLKFGIKTVC